MARSPIKDPPAIIISLLLAATLVAWGVGLTVYPFGILILCAGLYVRLLQLSSDNEDK